MYAHTPDAPPRWSRSCAARREVNSGSDSKGHGGRSRHWCPWTLACSKHRPSTCRRRHRYRWTPEPLITFHISATLVYSWFVRLRSVIVQPAHFITSSSVGIIISSSVVCRILIRTFRTFQLFSSIWGRNTPCCPTMLLMRFSTLSTMHRFVSGLSSFLMTDTMRHTLNCKILLPKFNTWEQVLLERENGFEVPLYSTVSGISAKKICRYGVIATPLHCNGDAITP